MTLSRAAAKLTALRKASTVSTQSAEEKDKAQGRKLARPEYRH